jgi:LysM repeat protein
LSARLASPPHTRLAALLAALVLTLVWLVPSRVLAEFPTFVHVVREGETLASIAQRYYGDPRRESALVAENGLETQGGVPIVIGLRLVIPAVAYHRVGPGETWASIAERYYGAPTRAFVIQEANPTVEGSQPAEGAELLVPYPLRHVADQRATVQRVAQQYFEDARAANMLRRFNGLRGTRLTRGQVILVPLADLVMSEEGRRVVAEAMPVAAPQDTAGDVRELQERISAELPLLQEAVRRGQYTEALAMGNRLLGAGELTGNQIVTIQRALAVAYVAVGPHRPGRRRVRRGAHATARSRARLEADLAHRARSLRRGAHAARGGRAADAGDRRGRRPALAVAARLSRA